MFRTRTELPEDAGEQLPRICALAHHVVESTADGRAPFLRGRWLEGYGDEDSVTEVWFGSQPRGEHGNRLHMSKQNDYHFKLRNQVVGWPFAGFDNAEAHFFERDAVRRLATADIDDER